MYGDVQRQRSEIRYGFVQADLNPVEGQFCQPFLLIGRQRGEGAFQQMQSRLMSGVYPVLQLTTQAAGAGKIPVFGGSRQVDGNCLRALILGNRPLDGFLQAGNFRLALRAENGEFGGQGKVTGRYDVSLDALKALQDALLTFWEEAGLDGVPQSCNQLLETDIRRLEGVN